MRYALGGFEFGKELLDVAAFTCLACPRPWRTALVNVGAGGDVEQALIGFCILNK
jgi:hypothetical protein